MLQQNRVGGFRFSADLCFRSMLGPLWATDMHTPGLTLKLQKTLSLFRHVRRVSVLRFFPPHPRDVPPQLRARCERAQLRRREQARPVIPATRQGVRRRNARPVDHRSAGLKRTWSAGAACPCRSASRTDLCTSMVWRSISGLAVAKATCRRLRVLLRVSRQPPWRVGRALLSVRSSREDRRCHRAPRARRPHRSPPAGSGRPGRRV
jgi:hypothetical protein